MRCSIDSLFPELAELALQIDDQAEFRRAWLSLLAPRLGFDSAAVFSSTDGQSYATHVFNADQAILEREVTGYIAELDQSELASVMVGRTVLDEEVFSSARRDQLRVYREYCVPHGTASSAARCWMRDGQVFFVFLSKQRGTKQFGSEDLLALDAVFPLITLGEALHARRDKVTARRSVVDLARITFAESTVVSLAQRGLTNPEIAKITGTRPATVRNQLSSAYRKLGVSNRTELTFLLAGIDCDPRAARALSLSAIETLLSPSD